MSDVTALTAPAPGWYPDRNEANLARWWDGQQWTEHTQSTGVAAADVEQPVSSAVFGFLRGEAEPAAVVEPAVVEAPVVEPAVIEPSAVEPDPIAGWYTDPWDDTLLRWWDGAQWTTHLHEVIGG